jgi:hypothetical protein
MSIVLTIIEIVSWLIFLFVLHKGWNFILNELLSIYKQLASILEVQLKYEIENKIYREKLAEYKSTIEYLIEENTELLNTLNSITAHKAPDLDD